MFQNHQYSHLSAVNFEKLIDRRQGLVAAGYSQGAVFVILTFTYNYTVISYSPVTKFVLVPACSNLPDGP